MKEFGLEVLMHPPFIVLILHHQRLSFVLISTELS